MLVLFKPNTFRAATVNPAGGVGVMRAGLSQSRWWISTTGILSESPLTDCKHMCSDLAGSVLCVKP